MTFPHLFVGEAKSPTARLKAMAFRHDLFCRGLCGEKLEVCGLGRRELHPDDAHSLFFLASIRGSSGYQPAVVGRLITSHLPTQRIWNRLPSAPPTDPHRLYFESSRVGMHEAYRGTQRGREALLGLIGSQVSTAVALGCHDYMLTLRPALFWSFPWLPWDLGDPFLYPASEGGPIKVEPVWPATLNLHELVTASRMHGTYEVMFPQGTDWWNGNESKTQLNKMSRLTLRNQQTVRKYHKQWKENPHILPLLRPRADAG